MDYEKKYKEALERAEALIAGETNTSDTLFYLNDVKGIFPELKDSEDERIRKELLDYLNERRVVERLTDTRVKEEWIAWLEKQSKKDIQVILPTFTFDDILALQCCMKTVEKVQKDEELYNQLKSLHDRLHDAYWLDKQGESQDKGEISDGYHTFNELYYYRMLYNAAFFNMLPKEWVHKSKKHHDGEECFGGGWFIVMANLPTGQISNHYELKDWDLFQIPEKEVADKWDGLTPQEAADRLHKYLLEKQGKTNWKPSKEEMAMIDDYRDAIDADAATTEAGLQPLTHKKEK